MLLERRELKIEIYNIQIGPHPNDTRVNLAQSTSEMLISFYCIVKPREAASISVASRPPGLRHPGTCLYSLDKTALAINGL